MSVWVEILHTRIAAADPDSIVRHHFECYFSRWGENIDRRYIMKAIIVLFSRNRKDIGMESSISSINDFFKGFVNIFVYFCQDSRF